MRVENSKGELIVLNDMEQRRANVLQTQMNALGHEISVTTLTTILKKVVEQKYYEIPFADFVPVRVGEGAWGGQLLTFRSFDLADSFETGIINTGGNNARLASADAGVDSVTIKIRNWAKSIGWSLFDLQMAQKSGNWDIVMAKERARKKNWDLGIQRMAFLGAGANSPGLTNISGITPNTDVIAEPIKGMTAAELSTFAGLILSVYRTQNVGTDWPTHFVIPESDYLGLAVPTSDTYPVKSKLALLMETFQVMTGNPNFKILPLRYLDLAYSGETYQQYLLYKYDEESLRMDIPVDYTNTMAQTMDNFSFQNVAYGQFTGVQALRPQNLMYFRYTP